MTEIIVGGTMCFIAGYIDPSAHPLYSLLLFTAGVIAIAKGLHI